jgi:drug/metabolite transporter (DMT)-like permease
MIEVTCSKFKQINHETELESYYGLCRYLFCLGTTYLAILFAIKDIPPLLMSAMRFLLAGMILYVFCLAKKEQHPDYNTFIKIMFRGILMLVGGTVSVTWA